MKNKKIYSSKRIRNSIIYHVICSLLALFLLYPIVWMVLASFKDQSEIFARTLKLLPDVWHFENYSIGWKGMGNYTFATFFWNSFVISTIATIGCMISSSLVGFGFARNRFVLKSFWFGCMLSTMMLPYQMVMIPQYLIFKSLGLVNTMWPIIIPVVLGTPFFIFMMTQFMRSIPKELDESAVIDGCSKFGIYFWIFLPLSKAALMTAAIFQFYWRWNDFIQPLIYLTKNSQWTVTVALKSFADPTGVTNWGAMFGMSTLSIIPVFLVFFLLQRHITEGISTTGIKG
jgi:multiple sugar transport system permease protein